MADKTPGAASVVLVHTAAEPVTAASLALLEPSRWPGGERQVIVVDCSGDRAGPDLPSAGSRLRIVVARPGTGLAAARNLGARAATGQFVAFLAPGAAPPPDWLTLAVEVFEDHGDVSCVATGIVGTGPPFVSFGGLALPEGDDAGSPARDVLHPHTEAMVLRASAFSDVGGFDEHYGRYGEEIDLGWRLWLWGHRVRSCPEAAVSLAGVAPAPVAAAEHRFLLERNALSTIYKNYDDANLAAALPAAMALAVRRGAAGTEEEMLASARAVDAFVEALPRLRIERSRVQQARRRTDQEITRLFGSPLAPVDTDAGLAKAHQVVVDTFGLERQFSGRRRILVVTPDVLSAKMAGPAIRAWHIAAALADEHEVRLVTTSSLCEVTAQGFQATTVDDSQLEALEEWADVLVLQGFILEGRPFLRSSRKVMVFDIYDPLHLEQLEMARHEGDAVRRGTVSLATAVLNEQLSRGDYFLCASGKQRDFWLGQMSGLGRINPSTYDEDETLESLIGVVPFGLPTRPPQHTRAVMKGVVPGIAEDDEVILWAGGVYNWFDPLTLIRAVDRLRLRRPKVRLFFMGLKHPNPDVREMRMAVATRDLARQLDLVGTHVFFNEGWVAYDDRQNYLLEADVGVSTHLDHVETAYSFRTRILDYLWAELPIVATGGDAFAELIEREALGLMVPPGDVEALEEALFRILDDEELSAVCKKNLAAVQSRFCWPTVLEPLLEFCRAPRRAPDLVHPRNEAATDKRPVPERAGLRRDVRMAVSQFREGGFNLLVRRAGARLRRSAGGWG